ncbi:Interferon-related protein PC4 like [Plasmopara halstedii]|uniref:Interferon-related protein PC4 like n=1 Tax=Plasmopara halstedii TaxID=4781 RepID=A0A0P1ADD5_PLAHL|nr:Interferon-related protein PC4 like [Plasmopara halstedii]CEG38793.1 Interferon-related protein PC4 like [Plasmopara halstedii]|eukprot:XP_024575162.1 Interferon-related protein PC4 like [Plasmopara halstedii]
MVKGTRAKELHPHLRRRLSETGRQLLRDALAEDSDARDDDSIDYSIISNCGDSSIESELEGTLQWERQQQLELNSSDKNERKERSKKWKNTNEIENADDDLEGAIEKLKEKRDTTKITALEKILAMLRVEVLSDRIQKIKVTLAPQILGCLKRRAKESSILALRVLSMVAITLGANEQKLYDDLLQPVQTIFTDRDDDAMRIEAVYALSIACFVSCSDDESKWELLEVLGKFLVAANDAEEDGYDGNEFSETLIVAVIKCWAFLVSSFQPSVIVGKVYNAQSIVYGHVAALADFVRNGRNISVRLPASEALALIVQFKYTTAVSWTYSNEPANSVISGLDTRIEMLMQESAKKIGKKNRKSQRSVLKDVLETLYTGNGPFTELQDRNETLTISTWSRFFQAHVFCRVLESGFQTHLVKNEVLRDIFEIKAHGNAKLGLVSTVERRAGLKAKSVHKRNDISRKDQAQNAFLFDQ